ncbi:DUF6898 family protein [Pelagibacterium lentulum]|uniref:DUF6898 domain-containing protein n=1 Tax=Pelagibacterium lentulum TaxID=2029865 RepID=A0A916VXI5_9HYPH|nr:serine hydroxymethyltransferase [Pelagibacterium lentulum]GGA51057.1 hypothetical protein GCM10011499_21320 [Pelagibacterium lentulum]
MSRTSASSREVLFEFHHVGQQVRVAAIDSETGIEVVVIAPVSSSQQHMKSVAMAKLVRRLQQEVGILTDSRPGRLV